MQYHFPISEPKLSTNLKAYRESFIVADRISRMKDSFFCDEVGGHVGDDGGFYCADVAVQSAVFIADEREKNEKRRINLLHNLFLKGILEYREISIFQ